jgi:uncharacterized protein YjcR
MKDNKQKLECREDYMRGISISRIAKEHKMSTDTIWKWAQYEHWEDEREKLIEEAKKRADVNIIEEKERSMRLIRAAEAKYAKELQSTEGVPKSTPAFSQLERVKWDILMPRNTQQFNFMKTETSINQPEYVLKIISPNDNSNGMATQPETTGSLAAIK